MQMTSVFEQKFIAEILHNNNAHLVFWSAVSQITFYCSFVNLLQCQKS